MTDRIKAQLAVAFLLLAIFFGALLMAYSGGQTVVQTLTVPPSTQPTQVTISVTSSGWQAGMPAPPATQPSSPTQSPAPSTQHSWLGQNLDANTPWQTQAPWCDVTHQMTGWYAVDNTTVTYDANGYPAAGHAKCHCWLYDYPSGTYHVHWDGAGPFYISAKTIANVKVEGAGHGGDVTFNAGDYCELYAQGPVTNVHLWTPDSGWQTGMSAPPRMYRAAFVAAVRPWHCIRLMPWCCVNYAPGGPMPPTTAATRVTASSFDQTTHGVAYEFQAELAKEANLSAVWVNLPYGAADDYITAAAQCFAADAAAGIEVDVEYQNELWNTGAGYQGNLIRADAQSAPAGTYGTGDANQLGARRAASLAAHAGQIFRNVLGAAHVKVIFGAQATWSAWASDGLGFVAGMPRPAGTPAFQVLAVAPYFQPVGGDPVSTPAQIEASCTKWIDTVLDPNLQANAAVAKQYGLEFWAYEGGQSLICSAPQSAVPSGVMLQMSPAVIAAFDADPFTLTQTDAGIGEVYDHLFGVAKKDGITRFMHFLLIGDWQRSGYWGIYRGLNDVGTAGDSAPKVAACRRAA